VLVTLKWLQDYVDIEEPVEEVADLLTRQGLEVSACFPASRGLKGVITARITSMEPHPEADKIWVCRMDTGKGEKTVLCGAQNVRAEDRVPLALPGTRLPNGKNIEATTIHGILSEGMICSESELGLSEDHEGIMQLSPQIHVGLPLDEALALDDDVLEIELTPNRPDCLSVVGVAREIAAKKKRKLRIPEPSPTEEGPPAEEISSVEILDPDACPRYVARILEGIRIQPSPFWLRNRLTLAGVRPINNIVDVTNYVMLELGQPLHAFDLDRLEEHRIVVRRASRGETLKTLDGETRKLDPQDLLICDGKRPVALAGVMGGMDSEITPETSRVLLESAFFEPRGIRRTAKRLGLSTEASHRFEREIDREGPPRAANRAMEMMLGLTGGRLLPGILDAYPLPHEPTTIRCHVSRVNQLLGTSIDSGEMIRLLDSLEIRAKEVDPDTFEATPPSFRPDITQEEDLVEEVARLFGYDAIPTELPRAPVVVALLDNERRAEDRARDVMVGMGFHEVIHYSFLSRDRLHLIHDSLENSLGTPIALRNPLSEAQAVLRTTLLSSLLDTVSNNLRRNNRDLKLFELRKVFVATTDSSLPKEKKMLTAVMTGQRYPSLWNQPEDPSDIFDLKGALEVLFGAFGMDQFQWNPSEKNSSLHPGCSGDILNNTTKIGHAGKLHPSLQDAFDLEQEVYLFEVEFDPFVSALDTSMAYEPFPRNPSVQRDIALVLDEALSCGQVLAKMRELADPRVTRMELFDLYRGPPIPEGKKSMAFRITYQDRERTLTDEEVNKLQETFLSELLPGVEAALR